MKKLLSQIVALVLVASFAFAEERQPLDLSKYPALTPAQIDLIRRLEKRGLAEDVIVNYIQLILKPKSEGPAIPAYKPGDIEGVTKWAVGGAYKAFARDARVVFDFDRYMADCPNLPLFGFGKATGTAYLHADVMIDFYNEVFELNNKLYDKSRDFREAYLELIGKTEFAKYVSVPEET